MADITFLLLLFFLVTTNIDVDTGIGLVLPEYVPPEERVDVPISKERLVNKTYSDECIYHQSHHLHQYSTYLPNLHHLDFCLSHFQKVLQENFS